MKSNRKTKTIILIILGILFAFSPINTLNLNFINSEFSESINLDDENLKTSALSGPIYIDDNNPSANWSVAEAAEICTGNGTYSDPYLIEDLVIDAGGTGSCIFIANSSDPFIIINCTLFNSGSIWEDAGIRLLNVNNSRLIDNNCSSNIGGIWLNGSHNNTISGNSVNQNDDFGLYLNGSYNNTVTGNTANNNYDGIYFEISHNNTVMGNTASNNIYYGISLISSDNNYISGNTANNNYYNVYLENSNYSTILGNNANNNYYGVYLENSNYNIISVNSASNNIYYGISLLVSDNNYILGNTANNNSRGISLWYSSNNNCILGNTANNNEFGISLWISKNNSISGNTGSNNIYYGISLLSSDNNYILENTANNNHYGVYLENSNYNSVSGNILLENDECIVEENCHGNKFSDNGDCTYGQGNGGIPIELIILISVISGGAVIGVSTLLLIRHKRKRKE
jgi:parallel beta-helix repeat protein